MRVTKISWQSRSLEIINVSVKKCLHLIRNGDPAVVNGCLSILAICVFKTCN